MNFARHVGYGAATIGQVDPNAVHTLTIGGANTFRVHVELARANVVYEGFARQVNQATAEAQCLVVGIVQRTVPEK